MIFTLVRKEKEVAYQGVKSRRQWKSQDHGWFPPSVSLLRVLVNTKFSQEQMQKNLFIRQEKMDQVCLWQKRIKKNTEGRSPSKRKINPEKKKNLRCHSKLKINK